MSVLSLTTMSMPSEIDIFLSVRRLIAIPTFEAEKIYLSIKSLPLSLSLMSAYDESASAVDIDTWNGRVDLITQLASKCLPAGEYYLFIRGNPRNYFLALDRDTVFSLVFEPEFCFPFAIFSQSLREYLFEDHSGSITASPMFAPLFAAGH